MLPLYRLAAGLCFLAVIAPAVLTSPILTNASGPSSDEWTLTTTVINTTAFEREPYVANGYIGARLPVEGFGLRVHPAISYDSMNGTQGWPLFTLRQTSSIVAGFYDQQNETRGTNFAQTGGEQVMSLLPTWSSLYLTVMPPNDNSTSATYRVGVALEQIKSFSQSLSLRNGIVQTNVTWAPFGSSNSSNVSDIQLSYTVLAHRSRPSLGLVRLDVSGLSEGQQVIITDALDGAGAQRVEREQAGKLNDTELAYAIYSAVNPQGIDNVTAWEISALDIAGGNDNYSTVDVPESVGLGNNQSTIAQSYSITVPSNGKLTVFKAVGIASSDAFEGKEREIALSTAEKARSEGWDKVISEHKSAWEDLWSNGGDVVIHGAGKSTGGGDNSMLDELQTTSRSSLFHLLSNVRDGNEGKGLGDNSIAPAGLTSDSYGAGIFWDADTWMYPSLLSLFPDYAMSINNYRSKNLGAAIENTDPDEYANFRDNAAFTNAGIAVTLRNSIEAASVLGKSDEVSDKWSEIADNISILYEPSSNIVLEYQGFNATTPVKQADVVLLIYPLNYTVRNAETDLAFYAGANSPNGPGMTYSIFGINSAQLSTQGCEAYTYLLQSSEPYVREPFSQFSEQTTDLYADNGGTNPAYTFLTGHGGYMQIWTHGFTGYRPRRDCFYLDPSLPPQLAPEGYTIRGMKWQSSVFDVTVGGSQTTITRRSGGSSNACVLIGDRNKKSGSYLLAVGQKLTVDTYRSDLNGTLVHGNMAQCSLSVSSNTTIEPGQYALAAVDGSNATYWRPSTKSPASISIDLGSLQTIKAFHFNFNNNPPISYSVYAGATNTTAGLTQVTKVDQVNITAPYDANSADTVMVRLGNTSDVSLAQSIEARYVQLVVQGTQTDDGSDFGATVAEIAVL
ncbi:alpha,alpha-trehalase ath1 [Dissophora globulifera]|uniref:Alpha,alpha-trehalase ath1 n=1 Tax=Dissophora globulifera TaxID=979702 RepID=A0A9P6RT35_9FUNG|nr:alpha,alpha-trehalase ath1 [Dissophora globulifera]